MANYCEVCDRDFSTEARYREHISTHETCGVDGCTFTANPKLIEIHYSMQHATGLYQKMKNLSTSEDIAKWVEERKKRFPTKANIELRKLEQLEKQNRGEVVQRREQFNNRNQWQANRNQKQENRNQRQTNRNNVRRRNCKPQKPKIPTQDSVILYKGVHPFSGTSNLFIDDENDLENTIEENGSLNCSAPFHISEDEMETEVWVSKAPNALTVMETDVSVPKALNALTMIADYASDSDEAPEEVPSKKMKIAAVVEPTSIATPSINHEDSDGPPEEVPIQKIGDIPFQEPQVPPTTAKVSKIIEKSVNDLGVKLSNGKKENKNHEVKREKNNVQKLKEQEKARKTRSSQLLYKLLSREIQHERNLIFQCLKHIVDNNFFE